MLRIYFTSDDVARTRIADDADPLWEVMMALQMLRRQPGDLLFGRWRAVTLRELRAQPDPDRFRRLAALSPAEGYFPDFLTPAASLRGMEHGLEAVRCTPIGDLHRQLGLLAREQRLPRQVKGLALAEPASLGELADTISGFHELTVAPHSAVVGAAIRRDRSMRVRALLDGGVEGLLRSLAPMAYWRSGELSVPSHRDQEIHLGGRGLTLIPSYFLLRKPLTLFDPELPPVLYYPVPRDVHSIAAVPCARQALHPLIGRTRTEILHELAAGRTTLELAGRLGISAPTVSEHAAILRGARLIDSHRFGNRVLHELTDLGRSLLEVPG
ncbi:transcriptional regulator [Catellatospora sp. TT07R-123]|uniref:winged helix-turn-helix domain-containing protein n=1 Tax=Catellatospora sp. TT07R-123 TaxID=2733863 RepID=UPI001B0B6FC8|nr:winged helix-turn-helix domain-containing protein [Catellatospora sp. TT07R-123]GHJ47997.1 transcriptional regulator [Catellatospora sp. TT07R-123]